MWQLSLFASLRHDSVRGMCETWFRGFVIDLSTVAFMRVSFPRRSQNR